MGIIISNGIFPFTLYLSPWLTWHSYDNSLQILSLLTDRDSYSLMMEFLS